MYSKQMCIKCITNNNCISFNMTNIQGQKFLSGNPVAVNMSYRKIISFFYFISTLVVHFFFFVILDSCCVQTFKRIIIRFLRVQVFIDTNAWEYICQVILIYWTCVRAHWLNFFCWLFTYLVADCAWEMISRFELRWNDMYKCMSCISLHAIFCPGHKHIVLYWTTSQIYSFSYTLNHDCRFRHWLWNAQNSRKL